VPIWAVVTVLGFRVMFKTNDLIKLSVSAVAAFALLYWLFDWSVVSAFVITVAYSVLALLAMYYHSKRSS
jgi:hypothetical protein